MNGGSSSNGHIHDEESRPLIAQHSSSIDDSSSPSSSDEKKQYYGGTISATGSLQEDSATGTTRTALSHISEDVELSQRLGFTIRNVVKEHAPQIGWLASFSIAVNSLTGPAMVDLPATYQRSGIIPTTLCLLGVCLLSALCSLHMANTISKISGMPPFTKEMEFSQAFGLLWGRKWFLATEAIFFACVTCLNLSSIVDTSQVVDTFVGHFVPGGSLAIHLFGRDNTDSIVDVVRWDPSIDCTAEALRKGECLAFGNVNASGGLLMTLGYVVILVIFLPMALMDLQENAQWQIFGFVVLLLETIQFAVEFSLRGLDNFGGIGATGGAGGATVLTWWGHAWDTLLGVVLFNFCLVIAIPAWLYERHPSVDVPTVIHGSSVLSTFLYMVVGILGALSIPHVSDNMLESMMNGAFGPTMQVGASLFAFMIIGLGIPLFSVLTRLNLTGNGLCSHRVGNLLAVYLPFSTAWLLYQGEAVTTLLSWGGVCFTSLVAFILPLLLALYTVKTYDVEGSIHVYGPRYFRSRSSQIQALYVLLALAVASVSAAIVGQFVQQQQQQQEANSDVRI